MEPNKRYTQTVERSFHVSMACLDASTAGKFYGPRGRTKRSLKMILIMLILIYEHL